MEELNFKGIIAQLNNIKKELSEIEKAQGKKYCQRKITSKTYWQYNMFHGILSVTGKIQNGNETCIKLLPDIGWSVRATDNEEYQPLFTSKVLEEKNPKYKFREYLLDTNNGRLYGPEAWNYRFLNYEYISSIMDGLEKKTIHGNGINDDAEIIIERVPKRPNYRGNGDSFIVKDSFFDYEFLVFC